MKQSRQNDARRGRSATAPAMFAAGLAVFIVAGATLSSAALAQGNAAPKSNSQPRTEAPIGHRQPRTADLPPSVARDEGARTPGQRAFDRELEICRGC